MITSLNHKGGVGKTHLCWLIASVCQERELRCLILDLDPQANATSTLLPKSLEQMATIERLFDPAAETDIVDLIQPTAFSHIDIVPGSPRLGPLNVTNRRIALDSDLHLVLVDALREVEADYDFILLDCPPSLALSSFAAMCASQFVLIPLEAAKWGALGTNAIVQAMDEVKRRHNHKLKLLGYVLSRFKMRRRFQQAYADQLKAMFHDDVFETAIPDLAAFEKSVCEHIPITLHSPSSHAAKIARDFFDEIVERTQRLTRRREPLSRERVSAVPASTI